MVVIIGLEFDVTDRLFKVSTSDMSVEPGPTILVIAAARPALVAPPRFPLNSNRHNEEAEGKVTLAEYTNFFMPGIEYEGLTHCVNASESGHTGVISTPAEGGSIARLMDDHSVAPL